MTTRDIVCPVTVAAFDELDSADRELVTAARIAATRAYAPYSHFHVGAAVRLDNGEIITGANQENAASPSGLCAERTALFYAGANHPDRAVRTIAVAARDTAGREVAAPISPCGACRQVMLEYEKLAGAPVRVILTGRDEILILPSVRSLVPLAFTDY